MKSVVNLYGGTPLGIFEKASTSEDHLKTWSSLAKKEMKLAVTHPPTNYFGEIKSFSIENLQLSNNEI